MATTRVSFSAGGDSAEAEPQRHGSGTRSSLATRLSYSARLRASGAHFASAQPDLAHGTLSSVVLLMLCNVMGAGVLSLPLAMHNASIIAGSILLFVMSFVSAFAAYAIVCGCEATGKTSMSEVFSWSLFPVRSFAAFARDTSAVASADDDTAVCTDETALRKAHAEDEVHRRRRRRYATIVFELMVLFNNFGALTIYANIIGDSMPPVVEHFLGGHGVWLNKWLWLGISAGIFFFLSCARHLQELKWTSLMGFLTIFYIVVAVCVRYGTGTTLGEGLEPVDAPEEERAALHIGAATNSVDTMYTIVRAATNSSSSGTSAGPQNINVASVGVRVLRTIATFALAYTWHFNVPSAYSELRVADRVPRRFMISVSVAMPIIVVCYFVTGILGYLLFGDLVATPHGGDIVNLFPKNDVALNVGRLGLFAHFCAVFPLLSVAARRGLHRIIMMLLVGDPTKAAAAPSHELSGLLDNDSGIGGQAVVAIDYSALATPEPAAAAAAAAGGESAGDGAAEKAAPASGRSVSAGPAALVSLDDPDRDVGSAEDTTRFAIIVEAFVIVAAAVCLAGVVPGMGVVVEVTGTCFGLFILSIAPGIIGIAAFGDARPPVNEGFQYFAPQQAARASFVSGRPFLRVASFGLMCFGVVAMVLGLVFLIMDFASE